MNLFVKFICLVLLIAAAAPFLMKGPDGKPLLTLDKLGIPSLSELSKLKLSTSASQNSNQPDQAQLVALKSKHSGSKVFYKWQDENGIWQFTSSPPPTQNFDIMTTHPEANIIQSLSKNVIDSALGRSSSVDTEMAQTPDGVNLDDIGGLSPTTIPVTQIPKLFNDAKAVREIMEQHSQTLEQI